MTCDRYEDYIKNSSKNHLIHLVNTVVNDISGVFQTNVTFGVKEKFVFSKKMQHYHNTGLPLSIITEDGHNVPFFLEGSTRVYEFNVPTWRYRPNKRFFLGQTGKGLYSLHTGTIFLCTKQWCRKTLTHETLHAVSLFSNLDRRKYPQFMSHVSLVEGLTETLTGYILMMRHPECFEGWIQKKYRECAIAGYANRVRLWASLATQIGITPLAKFYLSSDKSILGAWKILLAEIQKKGYPEFVYPFDENTKYDENRFKNVVFSNFPEVETYYTDLDLEAVFRKIK